MTVFVDTSAIYAGLDSGDTNHLKAAHRWHYLVSGGFGLVTTNYVVVETCALLQRRLGLHALRTFRDDFIPLLDVKWVGPSQHAVAMNSLLSANRRNLSLVDSASFTIMREFGIHSTFAFDKHFDEEGFDTVSWANPAT